MLSDADLAAIRERAKAATVTGPGYLMPLAARALGFMERDVPALLAEVERLRAKETESEWEYGWEASDASRRANRLATGYMGPRVMWDDTPHTPEEIAAFSHDQRIRRRKAGPIEPVEAGDGDE